MVLAAGCRREIWRSDILPDERIYNLPIAIQSDARQWEHQRLGSVLPSALLAHCPTGVSSNADEHIHQPPRREVPGSGCHHGLHNGWTPSWVNNLILGGWVLAVEAAFYLAAPWLTRWVKTTRAAAALVVVTLAMGVAVTAIGAAHRPDWVGGYWYYWPPAQLPVIAGGILLFFLVKRERLGQQAWLASPAFLWSVVATTALLTQIQAIPGPQFVFAGLEAMVILSLAVRPAAMLVNRGTIWLGKLSYGTFLCHFFVLDQVVAIAGNGGPSGIGQFAALYSTTLVGSILVAWAAVKLIERPVCDLGNRLASVVFPVAEPSPNPASIISG